MTYEQAQALKRAIWDVFISSRRHPLHSTIGLLYTRIDRLLYWCTYRMDAEIQKGLKEIEKEFKLLQMELLLKGENP